MRRTRDYPASLRRRGQAGGLFSLFVLHRAGFFVPPALRRGAVGSYPAFSPLPPILADGRRFIFCDTVRQREFALSTARVHHAARCLVVSGLSSKARSEERTPATVSGAATGYLRGFFTLRKRPMGKMERNRRISCRYPIIPLSLLFSHYAAPRD